MSRGTASPVVLHAVAHVSDFTAAAAERGGLERFVSAVDLASAQRHAAPEDGARALAARALARLLSARVLGLAPIRAAGLAPRADACRSCGGAHGKPGVEGVSVNWSRSGAWVMAAAAPPAAGPLGVDIERIPGTLFDGFDAHCLSPLESSSLAPHDVEGRMRLWVAKEALLKACGYGLSIPPAAVRTSPLPAIDPLMADGADTRALDGLSVHKVSAPGGYAAAASCRGQLQLVAVTPHQLFSA
ncbi:4'-phosphopantetheinyl transferase family protein [Arthrobacter sp.]|uniref:4'-phosphopantetheinyl transferase family protein n=1 Tax=Arthrobacter sp. TaxID=1667 RepID=UPI001EBA25A5|nr:4'-phosphopantetheinyl transferase superfamily protein [Micrococcaceae bacterium RIT 802]